MSQPPVQPPTYEDATKPGASFAAPPPQPQQQFPQQQPAYNPATNPQQPMQPVYIQQQPPGQTVIVQPGAQTVYMAQQPNVIIVHPIKIAPCFDPYTEVCPYCNVSVVTRRRFVGGGMTCVFLILALFFFPFIFFICCDSFKDAHHYCPRCNRLIAIRKR